MDFARRQLEKYGWTDGKGLGKNENGISQALKPKLKRSVAGVGHDAASEFTEHWWSALYNKAANNVQVEEKNGKTKKIKTKDNTNFEITNSTWRLNKKKKTEDGEYGDYFVKTAILTNGGVKTKKVRESESEDDELKKDVFKMTDEELFAACEGRTAHKGARFGIKATGKLARIKEQEEQLLKQTKYSGYSHSKNIKNKISIDSLQVVENLNLNSDGEINNIKKKKKKRKRCVDNSENSINDNTNIEESFEADIIESKSKKKSNKEKLAQSCSVAIEDIDNNQKNNVDGCNEVSFDIPKKKKKHKLNKETECSQVEENKNVDHNMTIMSRKKKKRKRNVI